MAKGIKPATHQQLQAIRGAVQMLRTARDYLALNGCPKAAAKTRLALSSAQGAVRHMENRVARAELERLMGEGR